jgi:predicted amidohydrolase YtcJ
MTLRLAALAALFVLAAPATASGLIDNVNGITPDSSGKIVRFNGLLIDEHGRIEKRLQGGDKRPKKLDFRFDGKGQTLVPGFVDARAEIMKFALSLLSLDLSAAVSAEDAVQRVAAYMRGNGGRRWILGTGWNDGRWPALPTAADLDRIAPDVPVWLVDSEGERGWANSAALRLTGITAATPQPAGGRIMLANGKPTGLLIGRAIDLVERIVPRPAPKDLDAAFLKAQAAFLARGITAVGDVGTDISLWQTYRRAGDRGALRLRITGYTASVDELPLVAGPAPTPWVYDGRLRLAGVALSIDGGLGARRAWLSAPYADLASESGAPLLDDTRLRNQMSRAAMDGFAIVLAAHGDQAFSEAVSAIAEMGETYGAKGRWRIDGADVSGTALPGKGVTIALPVHAIGDGGALARARLGARADTATYGWADLVNKGTVIGFHGHAPFAPLDPLAAMGLAVTRESRPDQRLSFGQALRAATAGGAAALGAEERFGSLEPGQYADFVLLDRDIEFSRPADIGGARVIETWMAGQKVILERGK